MRLFLCEKPSQAGDIARVVGARQRAYGCYAAANLAVTWCIGHLVEAAPPEAYGKQYKRWSLEALPIIPECWQLEIKPSTAGQFNTIRKLLATATELVIATDADREGEMIAREVIDLCGYRGPIKRLWLSALNDTSIRQALVALKSGSETLPLYHAALARSRADWLVGMNLSRLFTLLGRKGGYQGVLSVGRVQTPTLNLVVQRDREIERFVPVPFWAIDLTLSAGSHSFRAQWVPPEGSTDEAGRCIQHYTAQSAAQRLRSAPVALVTSVKTERVRESPPLPFDLSTLQETCSRRFGADVKETLDITQSLYERHKAVTYPRTDCPYLPENMLAEIPAVLNALLASDPSLQPLLSTLNPRQRSRAWDDNKIGAHHGIIPTTEPTDVSAMSDRERAVYRLIRAHYLAQLAPPHEYDRTIIELTGGDHRIRAHGKQIQVAGWRSLLPESRAEESGADDTLPSQVLPQLISGSPCSIRKVDLRALKTLPPKPYTQGELIKAMKGVARLVSDPRLRQTLKDTAGIGTEATRASIIQGLITRGYLVVVGRSVRASQAAFTLIDTVPPAVTDPGTTAVWEQGLDLIAAGEATLEDFVSRQSAWIAQLIRSHATTSLQIGSVAMPSTSVRVASRRTRRSKSGRAEGERR